MSILEIELTLRMEEQLRNKARQRGLPTSEYVRTALQGLLDSPEADRMPQRNIMELHGIGKKLWQGVNVDQYINELRDEWDIKE